MKSKTIIISSPNNSGRGILTLFEEDDLLKCKLRLYDMEKLNRYAKIGIYNNNEVFTANLLDRGGVYESSFVGNYNMDGDFYSAIIKTDNNNEVLLSGGTYAGFYFNNTPFDQIEQDENCELNKQNKNNNFETESKPEQTNFETDIKNENEFLKATEKQENDDDECSKCATCKYKEFFYNSNVELFSTNLAQNLQQDPTSETKNEPKIEKNLANFEKNEQKTAQNTKILQNSKTNPTYEEKNENDKKNGIASVLEQIIPQFDYIFENYPANDELNNLIENSKFVNINNEEYSLGAIFNNGQIEYICYALKCKYNTPPPEELGKYHQWLPLDKDDPLSDGYYLVFQDAKDLKIIKI